MRASGLLACPPPILSHRLSPVRLKFWCRPDDLSSTSALRFNDRPFRVRDNGPFHIAGPAASTARNAAFCAVPRSDHQAPLVRFRPLQRSPAALRCLGLPYPRRYRFSLALPARVAPLHSRGNAGSCGFSPPFASRSRDLVRRERRLAGLVCLWPSRWAANTRQPVRRRDLVELAARRRSWGSCPSQS